MALAPAGVWTLLAMRAVTVTAWRAGPSRRDTVERRLAPHAHRTTRAIASPPPVARHQLVARGQKGQQSRAAPASETPGDPVATRQPNGGRQPGHLLAALPEKLLAMTVRPAAPLSQGSRSVVSRVPGDRRLSPPWRTMSSSHSWTRAQTSAGRVSVTVRSIPAETSVLTRMWARSGSDDPGSTQARMISSPVGSPATVPSSACGPGVFVWSGIRVDLQVVRAREDAGTATSFQAQPEQESFAGNLTAVP